MGDSIITPFSSHLTVVSTQRWADTSKHVIKAVVTISFRQTRPFDTDCAFAAEATGFVVDAERGLICTNRHVVCAGPSLSYATFHSHEKCEVRAVWTDPVHDFGILRFDPEEIQHSDSKSLALRPDLAEVGLEVRLVGNDAGEKLSIFHAAISRMDCNAPEYCSYTDFNTNYIQAAMSATGGSSGSPVFNIDGAVVAMMAGARTDSATNYFTPLHGLKRALQCIQTGDSIVRGTIQTQWLLKPYDECRMLGLTRQAETDARSQLPGSTGLLVAEVILPQGPAHEKLEQGDILLGINGKPVSEFRCLEDTLDSSIDNGITLMLQRNGHEISTTLKVGNLHEITPSRFLEVAGGTFHNLSYQIARRYCIAVKDSGVYVCAKRPLGLIGWPLHCLIQAIDGEKTPNLEAFIEVVGKIKDRSRTVIWYKALDDQHRTLSLSFFDFDRHWDTTMGVWQRDDETGSWDFLNLDGTPVSVHSPQVQAGKFIAFTSNEVPEATDTIRSFVYVSCLTPLRLSWAPDRSKVGRGLVVDADNGLVIVSNVTVPHDMCDVYISVAGSIRVQGSVVFVLPSLGFALVRYDPKLVKADVLSANLSPDYVRPGCSAGFFGFDGMQPVSAKTTVIGITKAMLPATSVHDAFNTDAVEVDTFFARQCEDGVLLDDKGTVVALWMPFSRRGIRVGMPTPMIKAAVDRVYAGTTAALRTLNVGLTPIQFDAARCFGLDDEWIEKLIEHDPDHREVFQILGSWKPAAAEGFKKFDILLALNDRPVTRISDLDLQYDHRRLKASVIRAGEFLDIHVNTIGMDDLGLVRIAIFCGAVLHRPHLALFQSCSKIHSGIYVSSIHSGSPAEAHKLPSQVFVTHINDREVSDLDTLLRESETIPPKTFFNLQYMTRDHRPFTIGMMKDDLFFPTIDLIRESSVDPVWKIQKP